MLYWSELPTVELNEDTNLQWVHALSLGKYEHPTLGTLDFTPDRIQKFADSVNSKVRGIDPDIDYDHKLDPSKGKAAAGWVKQAETRSNGLWLLVEWTKNAKEAIKNREYRYFSTEFANKWKSADGNEFEDVILGGGITNRPFLKNLTPVNLSELTDDNEPKEEVMDRAELIKVLGLGEDASDDDIKTKLNELNSKSDTDLSKLDIKVSKEGKLVVTHPDREEAVWEGDVPAPPEPKETAQEKELEKLAEDNPVIAAMLSEHNTMKEEMKSIKATARLSEVTTQLSDLDDTYALPPVASDKFRDVMVKLPKQLSDDIAEGLKELLKVGVVELGEKTPKSKNGTKPNGDDAISKFLSEVDSLRKEDPKLSTREASDRIRAEQPQLYSEYVDAVEAGVVLSEEG